MESIRKEQTATNASSVNLNKVKSIVKKAAMPIGKPVIKQLIKEGSQHEKLDTIINKLDYDKKLEVTKKEKKVWRIPFKWKRTLNKSIKSSKVDKVLCFFINKKSELESPVFLPIFNGNCFVYKYTIHEIDPRDILTFVYKKKFYKVLIYRIMDRKAVSNRDYAEVRARGDSTIDDEVFIKAMLTAKASQVSKQQIGKGALIVGGLVLAGVIIWIFSRS